METKSAIVLRHKTTGLYFDYHAEHTSKLWSAWRFTDEENVQVWLENSIYAPVADEYERVPVELTISIKEESA